MLGKLLKYDLQATKRSFLPMYIGLIVITVFNKILFELTIFQNSNQSAFLDFMAALFMIFYVFCVIAAVILTAVFIVTHFYKTMTGDESYLTMTLPVSTTTIIASKLLCAVIWEVITTLLFILSIIVLTAGHGTLEFLTEAFFDFIRHYFEMDAGHAILLITLTLIYGILQTINGPLKFYFCIAIGHLSRKYRILGAIAAYFVLHIILQIVNFVRAVHLTSFSIMSGVENFLDDSLSTLWTSVFIEAVLLVLFYAGSVYIFKNKLNVE